MVFKDWLQSSDEFDQQAIDLSFAIAQGYLGVNGDDREGREELKKFNKEELETAARSHQGRMHNPRRKSSR